MSEKGITKRSEDYSQWYLDVIEAADLADYGPVKGTMVIKPNGYAIWENIQQILNEKFKETGVKNAYFPLLIPESFLKREAEHVEGFAPEVAVVTQAGGKKLEEPLVIRPTSETIIYDSFSKWIKSYRDLPVLINQWANIVRWEMRTRLFLRTSEFLWQEGHTAHATHEEAQERQKMMLDVYKEFAEDYLAIPVIAGEKSESERFAGAERTYSIEAMMQDKKALQAGTSHILNKDFAESFNVKYLDQDGKEKFAWLTSWGVSTRLIGGLIMAHSDDSGLVLPPKIAPIQVVVIPVWSNETEKKPVFIRAKEIFSDLGKKFRAEIDLSDTRTGAKFYDWEKKGVPIRIEVGPRDIQTSTVIIARRDTGEKKSIKMSSLSDEVAKTLGTMQKDIFDKAKKFRDDNTFEVDGWGEFERIFAGEGGFVMANWCGSMECEKKITEKTKATIRCILFDQPMKQGKCILCGGESKQKALFAKAY
ncbi:MAG: proline--tRNA ligase [bacterium]|nr:proline--tRNA ligase [bacterium]